MQFERRIVPNLRRVAFEHNASISKIARKTGISRTTLTALYKGDGAGVTFATLEKLCGFFNCGVGDLLTYSDDQAAHKEAANQ